MARECRELADEVADALAKYAIGEHLDFGAIYPFEVDGLGNRLYMDDAGPPSLLSLPYFGACETDDPVYQNTRRFILSEHNPYFFRGKAAAGIGSPHTLPPMVWPLGLTMQGLTSTDDDEIAWCLRTLLSTHAGTGFIHESFHPDDPANFTRSWFAWANTLFGELVLKVAAERPGVLAGL